MNINSRIKEILKTNKDLNTAKLKDILTENLIIEEKNSLNPTYKKIYSELKKYRDYLVKHPEIKYEMALKTVNEIIKEPYK